MVAKQKTKVEDLKSLRNIKTSEELFDLQAPVDYQCPNFDRVVSGINAASKALEYSRWDDKEDVEVALDKISDVEWSLSGLVDEVENLRTAIEEVRDWGVEWKEFAKRIIEDNDIDLEKYVSE